MTKNPDSDILHRVNLHFNPLKYSEKWCSALHAATSTGITINPSLGFVDATGKPQIPQSYQFRLWGPETQNLVDFATDHINELRLNTDTLLTTDYTFGDALTREGEESAFFAMVNSISGIITTQFADSSVVSIYDIYVMVGLKNGIIDFCDAGVVRMAKFY